jgi:hypothetical protein
MDIARIEKKLREAATSLNEMVEQERMAFGDKERFDVSLSSFLSAAMSVRDAVRYERDRQRNEAIKAWKEAWEAGLTPGQRRLYDFMREDRNAEVHGSGSRRTVKTDEIKVGVGSSYSDKSGTLEVMGSPLAGPATINKPTYYFTIDGNEQKATEACAEYLELLERMVAKFKADHP